MKSPPIFLLAMILLLALSTPAWAIGTLAGTVISSTANAAYRVGTQTLTKSSNTYTFSVAELINVSVVAQDGGNVSAAPGSTNQFFTYRISNTGNGSESFTLAADTGVTGDNFDPTLVGYFADSNDNGQYDPGTDLAITGGIVTLAADAGMTVFVVNNIPATDTSGTALFDGQTGLTTVSVASNTGSGARGTVIAKGGDGGTVDAIIGATAGLPFSTTSTVTITSVAIDIVKSAAVVDPFGGNLPVPGAVVTYKLDVIVSGSGTALGLVITDPIPASTTYKPGSLTLNGTPLSDGTDGDAGAATGTPVNLVSVSLGDTATGTRTITFAVTIN